MFPKNKGLLFPWCKNSVNPFVMSPKLTSDLLHLVDEDNQPPYGVLTYRVHITWAWTLGLPPWINRFRCFN